MSEAVRLIGIDPSIVRRIENAILLDSCLDLRAQRFCPLCRIPPTDESLHFRQGIQRLNGLDFDRAREQRRDGRGVSTSTVEGGSPRATSSPAWVGGGT